MPLSLCVCAVIGMCKVTIVQPLAGAVHEVFMREM